MALEQKLQLRLSQKLVMTPSLQQAIKLLQMTRLELQTTLTQEMEENPVLEESEVIEEEAEKEQTEEGQEEAEKEPEEKTDSMDDIDLEAYFSDYWEGSTGPSMSEVRAAPPIENSLSREPDLYDHLLWQLHMSDVSDRQREIAELIVGNLDPDGFWWRRWKRSPPWTRTGSLSNSRRLRPRCASYGPWTRLGSPVATCGRAC